MGNASWSPSYNLRATEARDQVTVEYNASIRADERRGLDGRGDGAVDGDAVVGGEVPKLDPLTIKLGAAVPAVAAAISAADSYLQVQASRAELERLRGTVMNGPDAKSERSLARETEAARAALVAGVLMGRTRRWPMKG